MQTVAITRRACIMLLGSAAVAWPCAVIAQTPAKVYRLGVLSGGAPVADASPLGAALLRGLAQHGLRSIVTWSSNDGAPKGTSTACRASSTN